MSSKPETTALATRPKNRFSASVAEFLLLFRLRARRTPEGAVGVIERALRMVLVTCEHWFGRAGDPKPDPEKRR